ncbi:uncharacterized protein LOC131224738 [Magnolia sinica]|uniref:uncharacterized protein LOC131224738 n=1 Tax=Magnolia sinica TaxID=86752 RepID=UPI00265AB838|nr:uncharacterized protein LOC131224738 [Magnolia sinica]
MEIQSEPISENLSQSHLQSQNLDQVETAEEISSVCDGLQTQENELADACEEVPIEFDGLTTQNLDLVKTNVAILDGCSHLNLIGTHEAASTGNNGLQTQNLDFIKADEEISTVCGNLQVQNLNVIETNEEILTEFRSIRSQNGDFIDTHEDIPIECSNLPTRKLNLVKTDEGLSSESDTLWTQNQEVSIQFEYFKSQNLDLINTLEEISAERDSLCAQNFNLIESFERVCSERDNLQSNLHRLENEISSLLEERSERIRVFSEGVESLTSVKGCLKRIADRIAEGKTESSVREAEQVLLISDEDPERLSLEVMGIYKLAMMVESQAVEHEETRTKRMQVLSESIDSLRSVKECLARIAKGVNEDKTLNFGEEDERVLDGLDIGEDMRTVFLEITDIHKLAMMGEARIMEHDEMRRREMEEVLEETRKRTQVFSDSFDSLHSLKECLVRIFERVDREKTDNPVELVEQTFPEDLDLDEDSKRVFLEITDIYKLAAMVEARIMEHDETRRKETKELEERSRRVRVLFNSFDSLRSVRECLERITDRFEEVSVEKSLEEGELILGGLILDEESNRVFSEITGIRKLVMAAEARIMEHEETRKKEIRELENSVVSLTEENRDISSLLRIALVEKEAVEKSLSRLKGGGGEQRRVAILQIVQKVGFGFMMGSGSASSASDPSESSSADHGTRSDSSESAEEVVSLASTVEKIMKNLRLEITQLKRSLDESRSDGERLQSLTEKQAQKIEESTLYIKDLEERETILTQNVEELMMELAEAEEEIVRWREACELEVEAAKAAVEERDKEVAILKEELEKTKVSLELSNNKLKLKEELATAAMAAQVAAEQSLQLADSRSAILRDRIEELTRQLEEADSKGERAARRKARHVCWPWRALRVNPAAMRRRDVSRRRLPEMEALLHNNI